MKILTMPALINRNYFVCLRGTNVYNINIMKKVFMSLAMVAFLALASSCCCNNCCKKTEETKAATECCEAEGTCEGKCAEGECACTEGECACGKGEDCCKAKADSCKCACEKADSCKAE